MTIFKILTIMIECIKAGFNESIYTANDRQSFCYIATCQGLLSAASMATIIALILYATSKGNGANLLLSAKITGGIGAFLLVDALCGNFIKSFSMKPDDEKFFYTEGFKTILWAICGPAVFCYNVCHGNAQEEYYAPEF